MFVITPLPFYPIAFHGEQARSFLQGQVSCDVMQVSPEQSILGCYANPKGRVEAIFHLFEHKEACSDKGVLYMLIPYDERVAEYTQNSLKKVAPFSKVTVEVDKSLKVLGVNILSSDALKSARMLGFSILDLPQSERKILIGSEQAVLSWKQSLEAEYKEDTLENWIEADFHILLPHITAETIGLFLPHHLNLLSLGALNFKKGCYKGQEIIARMHYKSTIKKHLELLFYPTTQTLDSGQNVEIVNFLVNQKTHTTLALGIVDAHG